MRVSLFATCLADQFYAQACADAVRLLRHLGVEVDVPEGQTCCGQPAYNAGRREEARGMAEHTIDVFSDAEYVVLPSGSCAGMIRCFYDELTGPDSLLTQSLARRTYELSQFLRRELKVDALGVGLQGRRVAYHHGCHALRELGVKDEPVALLAGCGAEVVEWEADEECCGFGGLFSAKLPEVSAAMADRKLDTLSDVDFVTSSDGGCLLQLSGRASKRGSGRGAKRGSGRGAKRGSGRGAKRGSGRGAKRGLGRGPHRRAGPRFVHLASALWQGVGR